MMPNGTLPLSLPSNFNADFASHGIFATLTPSNFAAAHALSNLVDAIIANPTTLTSVSRFVRLHSRSRRPVSHVLDHTESPSGQSFSSDATVEDSPEPEELLWHACFIFSFGHKLCFPHIGWTVGYGPQWSLANFTPNDMRTGKPDMMLALGLESRHMELHKTSARFNFLPGSGAFAVAAMHTDRTVRCGSEYLSTKYVSSLRSSFSKKPTACL